MKDHPFVVTVQFAIEISRTFHSKRELVKNGPLDRIGEEISQIRQMGAAVTTVHVPGEVKNPPS